MDTAETPRPNHELARMPELPPALRQALPPVPRSSGSSLNPRLVLRGLARHWWQALALWIVGTAALATLAYYRYEPTYESSSLLQVEPYQANPFSQTQDADLNSYLQTQVRLITSSSVLAAALSSPEIGQLSSIREADDDEAALREMLKVRALSRSYLIEVAAESTVQAEPKIIVDAVVKAFLDKDREYSRDTTRLQGDALRDHRAGLVSRIDVLKQDILKLAQEADDPGLLLGQGGGDDQSGSGGEADSLMVVDIRRYSQLQKELLDVEFALIEARAMLEATRREAANAGDPRMWIDRRVEQEFVDAPEVQELRNRLRALDAQLAEYRRRVRNHANDPALQRLEAEQRHLVERYELLWREKEPVLRAALQQQSGDPEQVVREAQAQVRGLEMRRDLTGKKLDQIAPDLRSRGVYAVRMRFLNAELQQLAGMEAAVQRRIEQLEFEGRGQARISEVNPARVSNQPLNSGRRTKYLALTPIAVLGLVLGLVTLVEMRAGRVSGADELSVRLPAEVFAVPPLPTARRSGRRKLEGPDEQFEQFVQQLDHLRVALCGDGTPDGRGRCVLITSAVGGEGKTTLAAQLAVRCAEAGASTVLIDADLRRAMLGKLFEVPECPGLSDVLRGDATLEDALVPISQVGGCQLLPAGSPEANPGRILQGKAFGPMLERLRRSFDVVIIDTSPVLPVPDALILGRHADGVVLATRHDQSRFPAVERANHLMAGAGIPVLGVVVNGARPSATRFNNYSYSYRPDRSPEPTAPGAPGGPEVG